MKNIHWLVPYDNQQFESIKNSNLASIRLRLSVLLNQQNHKITCGDSISGNPDFIVIGKIGSLENSSRENLWLFQIAQKKENGSKIILDYTDNHLNFNSSMSSFYKKSLSFIDGAVASSSFLANELKQKTTVPVKVIPDAIEIKSIKPISKKTDQLNILWFGHASNINYLIKFIDNLKNIKNKIKIFILTNQQGLKILEQNMFNLHTNLSIYAEIWSIESMISTSKICNLAIIPSDPNDLRKAGASSNRLITSFALGLPTAADIMHSYKEFNKYFTDIRSDKLFDLMKDPDAFHCQVLEAQREIVPSFSSEVISQKWIDFFYNPI